MAPRRVEFYNFRRPSLEGEGEDHAIMSGKNEDAGISDGGASTVGAHLHPVLRGDAPEEVMGLAAVCVDYVRRVTGVEPDGTADTLGLVDHYLLHARTELAAEGVGAGRPELELVVARAAGAYFGELARALLDGFWRRSGDGLDDWQVCSRVVFLAINPFGVAYDALHGKTEHDGPSSELIVDDEDRRDVEARLAELPPVAAEDYFLLSTRLEVLEAVSESLRVTAQEQGVDDVRFEPEDYADR